MEREGYRAWLTGELLLLVLLSASLVFFVTNDTLPTSYPLPEVRLVLATGVLLAGALVALLAGIRFTVEGRRFDLFLACGFTVGALETLAFAIVPTLGGNPIGRVDAWADVAGRVLTAGLLAAAPLAVGTVHARTRLLRFSLVACTGALAIVWLTVHWLGPVLPEPAGEVAGLHPSPLTLALSLQVVLNVVALTGFAFRFRRGGEDLHRWLALGATFLLFSTLHRQLTPVASSAEVSQADFLRVLGYALLLVGVWRAIRAAEFGRAVAEERARVAREIHDGLAQYLFAMSAQVSMLENGAAAESVVPRLKEAATSAQREARFAVLALSSASGGAPFDAALRRYVDFLTADGELDVDLDIDPLTRLGPDEQIELFRIVQEGLANVRKHAGARRAEVRIGRRGGRRLVSIRDDGSGLAADRPGGQGLKNMRARAASIGGALEIRSSPGLGTALEVMLRA
jgi:signal transduction histidine kinase